MAATFVAILTALLLGYLMFQAEWLIKRQRRVWPLALHAAIVTLVAYLLLGTFHWRILFAIFLAQLVMDAIQVYFLSDSLASLLVDQFAKLAVLLAFVCCFRMRQTVVGG